MQISILTANLGCGSAALTNEQPLATATLRCAGATSGYAYGNGFLRHVPATGQA
ncbi:MAG TPA: hypothetical protein VGA63_08265 [Geopsychrobacteraceae bacterium]